MRSATDHRFGGLRGLAHLWDHACQICGSRIGGSGYYYEEPGDAPEPRQSWTLCAACAEALQQQIGRATRQSPLGLRIAMGMVASERGTPGARQGARRDAADDEVGFNRLLLATVWAAFLVHAVAFIVVVAVIAAEH
jgi:hypothetical protein